MVLNGISVKNLPNNELPTVGKHMSVPLGNLRTENGILYGDVML